MPDLKGLQRGWDDYFVAESDAFVYDKLAVDQASADPSDGFIPVEQIRPMESLLPTDSSGSGDFFDEPVLLADLGLLGTSDAFAQTDFFIV